VKVIVFCPRHEVFLHGTPEFRERQILDKYQVSPVAPVFILSLDRMWCPSQDLETAIGHGEGPDEPPAQESCEADWKVLTS
jgi:hypothetical protein